MTLHMGTYCRHGNLKNQCIICKHVAYIERLEADNARLLALNEKMRKALEGFASFPHVERDADHPMWGNFDDSYSHGASVAESQVADIAREALQTEKEEKPQ